MGISTYYRVVIDGSSFASASAPRDGFIDSQTVQNYAAANGFPSNFTLAESRAKERGNIRYLMIIQSCQLMCNLYVSNVSATGGAADATPTAFAFTFESERGDSVLDTNDELNAGARLTGAAAIERCVARALIKDKNDFGNVYDPTETTAPGNSTPAVRMGMRDEMINAAALISNSTLSAAIAAAEAVITVTKIGNVN